MHPHRRGASERTRAFRTLVYDRLRRYVIAKRRLSLISIMSRSVLPSITTVIMSRGHRCDTIAPERRRTFPAILRRHARPVQSALTSYVPRLRRAYACTYTCVSACVLASCVTSLPRALHACGNADARSFPLAFIEPL